jgi:lipid-binding SYLF domain-containing protein
MTDEALRYLDKSDGWSVGSGLSVVFIDDGFAKPMNTTTLTQDVYAMAFSQRGLMAGSGLEGARIRQIFPAP